MRLLSPPRLHLRWGLSQASGEARSRSLSSPPPALHSPACQEAVEAALALIRRVSLLLRGSFNQGTRREALAAPTPGLAERPRCPSPEGHHVALHVHACVSPEKGPRCASLTCAKTEEGAEPWLLWVGPELGWWPAAPQAPRSPVWRSILADGPLTPKLRPSPQRRIGPRVSPSPLPSLRRTWSHRGLGRCRPAR